VEFISLLSIAGEDGRSTDKCHPPSLTIFCHERLQDINAHNDKYGIRALPYSNYISESL